MNDTNVAAMERNIARSRIMLSVAAILSVYIDPTTPSLTRWVLLSGGLFKIDAYALTVLGLHLLYAVSTYIAVSRWQALQAHVAAVSTVADVLFGVAIAVVTEGVTSPAYVFFAFAILTVGCRAGFRVIMQVTAACVVLYLGLIVVSAERDANAYLMRPTYLAITGYLIAYLAQQKLNFEVRAREIETRAERQGIARALHDGYVQALAAVNLRLETCRKLLQRGRGEDALTQVTELQGEVRHEYDEVRAYLRSLVDMQRRPTPWRDDRRTRFTVSADFRGSGVVVEHVLQIMLEGVRNARRHAHASSTAICARASEHHVRITIDDDGVGFDDDALVPWTIASRVENCGGDVRIVHATSEGAHLVVEIPQE